MKDIKTPEELFTLFVEAANKVGLDTTLWPTMNNYFENLDTQGAWMLWTRAYMLGVKDGTDNTMERVWK